MYMTQKQQSTYTYDSTLYTPNSQTHVVMATDETSVTNISAQTYLEKSGDLLMATLKSCKCKPALEFVLLFSSDNIYVQ